MIPCVLSIWTTANNRVKKIRRVICLGLYIGINLLFGFTRIFLICVLAIILFYELRKTEKKKQIIVLALSVVALAVLMLLMNLIRNTGLNSVNLLKNRFTVDYFLESTDFGASYKYFSELLKYESPYINPIVWLKAIFAAIPRSVWASKPEPLSLQVLKYTNPMLAATGYSTAGNSVLGEGYAIMGVSGIFLFPFIWGIICNHLDIKYYNRIYQDDRTSVANIIYYIFTLVIVISCQRGDWSQYTIFILWFHIIPLFAFCKLSLRLKYKIRIVNRARKNRN